MARSAGRPTERADDPRCASTPGLNATPTCAPICAAADDDARPFFLRDVRATGIDACGENGEYHSFAFAGPFFTRSLAWNAGERRDDGRFAQLGVNVGALLSR